ncbi:MAG: chemotaxis protein CheD [Firmicutes bacterium]|nr:chemotaxis protein CheD [Bacillota bacterium]
MKKRIKQVGMAQYAVGWGDDVLRTLGLGSCVGVCLYDLQVNVGGLVHIMLPEMALYQDKSTEAKYADTGIKLLVGEMERLGARQERLLSKLAGGAQMFSFPGQSEVMRIGERNVLASRRVLQELGIPIVAEHTGGNFGRTIEFACTGGELEVRTIGHGTFVI